MPRLGWPTRVTVSRASAVSVVRYPWPLEGVDGLDQHADIGVPAGFGGPFQVFDVHLVAALAAFAIRHDAGKYMDEPALKDLSVFQRLANAVAEFGLAAGQVRDAVFARLHVAGGGKT